MWNDQGAPMQRGGDNLRIAQRQNSENAGRVEQNQVPPHLVPVTRAYSGTYVPQGFPPHQAFVPNNLPAPFTASLARYPSWTSLPPQPSQGGLAIRAPIPTASPGLGGPPPFNHGEFYLPQLLGDFRGAVPNYPAGTTAPHEENKMTRALVLAHNIVAVVTILLHIPAGMLYSKMLANYAVVLVLAPLGAAFGFAAVYSPACDCAENPEVGARRIRALSSAAVALDTFAVIFAPLAMDSERRKTPAPPLTKKNIPFEDGAGYVIALFALLHLVICIVVWTLSGRFTKRNQQELPVPAWGQMRSFTTSTPLPL